MTAEKAKTQIPWTVWGTQKPTDVEGYKWEAIKTNPLKPQQIQGWKRVEIKIKAEPLHLHPPQEVGIPEWQKRELED